MTVSTVTEKKLGLTEHITKATIFEERKMEKAGFSEPIRVATLVNFVTII